MLPFQEGVPSPPAALPQAGALTPCYPQHCLLGWDILPPKSEKSSAPKSLDLWSCVSKASTGSCRLLPRHTWYSPGCPGRDRCLGPAGACRVPGGQDWGGSARFGSHSLWDPAPPWPRPLSPPWAPLLPTGYTPPILEGDPKSEIQKRVRLEMG